MKRHGWILILVLLASCQNLRFQDFTKRKYCDLKKVRTEKKEAESSVMVQPEPVEIKQVEAVVFEEHHSDSIVKKNNHEVIVSTIDENSGIELGEEEFKNREKSVTREIPLLSQSKLLGSLRQVAQTPPEKTGKGAGILFWLSVGMSTAAVVLFVLAAFQFSIILLMSSLTAAVLAILLGYLTSRKLNQIPKEKKTKGQRAQKVLLALVIGIPGAILTVIGLYGLLVLLVT